MPDGDTRPRRRPQPRERRDHHLRRDTGTPRGARVCIPTPRSSRAPDPRDHARYRWWIRAEDHGATRRDVRDARRVESPGAGEVDRGPAREPDGRRAVASRARHRPYGVRRVRHHPGSQDRLHRGLRRLPGALSRRRGVDRRRAVPGPVPGSGRYLHDEIDLHEHRRTDRVPGSMGVRVARARAAPGPCGPPDRARSRRAATAQPAPQERSAVHQPERHDVRLHQPARDLRARDRHARLRRLSRGAGTREEARPISRRRHVHLRRAHHAGRRHERDRRCHDPHRTVRQGQRLRVGRIRGQQPRDRRRAARGRRTRRRHLRRLDHPGRHRDHAVRGWYGGQPQRLDARRCDCRDRIGSP